MKIEKSIVFPESWYKNSNPVYSTSVVKQRGEKDILGSKNYTKNIDDACWNSHYFMTFQKQ